MLKHTYQIYFNYIPYIVIDDHVYDDNHINGIIDLTYKGIGVRQSIIEYSQTLQTQNTDVK